MSMAIVKATYTKSPEAAKATIRYIAHRPGREQEPGRRVLWTADGVVRRSAAYQLIDQAPTGSTFFRFAISPDPAREDSGRDLYLRDVTEATMGELEERIGKPVVWVAATHADHAPHRHTHVVAVVQGRLNTQDLRALTSRATTECREQRLELDAVREQRAREEEAAWELAWY